MMLAPLQSDSAAMCHVLPQEFLKALSSQEWVVPDYLEQEQGSTHQGSEKAIGHR